MTGACRPTPPECIAKAIAKWDGYGPDVQTNHHQAAQAVWDALLAEGEIEDRGYTEHNLTDHTRTFVPTYRVLVVPLVADEKISNNDKEDYEGGVNWP